MRYNSKVQSFKKIIKMNKLAFTLAEVLLTLGIIGIVAAITLPVLLQNIQAKELRNAFKSVYSDVAQMAAQLRADNGGTLEGVFTDTDQAGAISTISSYLSAITVCNNTSAGLCRSYTTYNYLGVSTTTWNNYSFILKNGAKLRIPGSGWVNASCPSGPSSMCMGFSVDVNGLTPPNTTGKDIFFIRLQADRTVPAGLPGDVYADNCGLTASGASAGIGCATWVLQGIDY